jgi:uncharacterized membrane protein
MNLLIQVASLAGALMILAAYFALQRGRWSSNAKQYLWLNIVGAALLTIVAIWDRSMGFIALEASWVIISLRSLLLGSKPRNLVSDA